MPFKKGNPYRFKGKSKVKLDKSPICFLGYEDQKVKLKSISNWQEKLRQYINQLIDLKDDFDCLYKSRF